MSGMKSKSKGYRGEANLVKKLKEAGIPCSRIPLSGAVGGKFAGDIELDSGQKIEVKVRKAGFKFLYDNLESADYLAVKQDNQDYLVVMRLKHFTNLFKPLA
ncbi:conserved hypothetical protein [Candidatus Defluviicoccus seviourii]|uniref:Protein NO VEIN C-terminal domain-containing protein n=1 Tax=Candidatus Defluviicoccus seviourii TaxID=2565273 RepID=A0A564WJK1_9PROT|nr:conserved hypothetical protein [Candidatus Defluviicoccus seviourii]